MGGVWLCKQPSEAEGLDKIASDEENADTRRGDTLEPRTDTQELGTPTCDLSGANLDLSPISCSKPVSALTGLKSRVPPGPIQKTDLKEDADADDVFATDSLDEFVAGGEESDKDASEILPEPPQWLTRAISICSEGEDLEVLASEADTEECCNDLGFPRAFSDQGETEILEIKTSELDKPVAGQSQSSGLQLRLDSEPSASDISRSTISSHTPEGQSGPGTQGLSVEDVNKPVTLPLHVNCKGQTPELPRMPKSTFGNTDKTNMKGSKDYDKGEEAKAISISQQDPVSSTNGKTSNASSFDSKVSVPNRETSKMRPAANQEKLIPDLVSITPGESDYLLTAAQAIRKALDCEVNGMYEDAFNLYKTCVGLLLSGVQGTAWVFFGRLDIQVQLF